MNTKGKNQVVVEKILKVRDEFEKLEDKTQNDQLTCVVFSRALSFTAFSESKDVNGSMTAAEEYYRKIHPRESLEWRQLVQTYLGITAKLDSRFDIAYLAKIPLMVLIGCMPAIRRADYLVENGKFTSVSLSKDRITLPITFRSSKSVYVSDISKWHTTDRAAMIAPYDSFKFREVSQGHYEDMEFFDSTFADEPILDFVFDQRVPKYDNPKNRYYDLMAGGTKVPGGFTLVDLTQNEFNF